MLFRGSSSSASSPRCSRPVPVGTRRQVPHGSSSRSSAPRVKTEFEAANSGTTLTISTDSSAALETKIEQGAPADVFLSADTINPQKLIARGLATGPMVVFAGNKLTIVVPKDNPAGVKKPADLARAGVDVIAAGDEVPITKYATQLIHNLAGLPGYPAGFEAAYAANVASREENVGAIVGKIALGQGDAGIVYVTDAAAASDVRTVDVPASANVIATYGGVLVKASKHEAEARAFLAWLAGPSGQAVLARFGFLPAPS
ncbi:MAG: molybdate ABC transporter substrate-binding protein [Chloroflexi bacterium]|nr:MAG: molybdate ABC transporter substrate-binding protein [Chloroflexota bacterium]